MNNRVKRFINPFLAGVSFAMGVGVIVSAIFDSNVDTTTQLKVLGIAVVVLSLLALNKNKNKEEDKNKKIE